MQIQDFVDALGQAPGVVDVGLVTRRVSSAEAGGPPGSWEVDVDTDVVDLARPFGRVSVRFSPYIPNAHDPYNFFARRSDAPWFQKIVYACLNESTTGRCTTFEGNCWYTTTPDLATVVDSRLTPAGLARVVGAFISSIRSQLAIESVINSITLVTPTNPETECAVNDTMRAISMNRACQIAHTEHARAHVARIVFMLPPLYEPNAPIIAPLAAHVRALFESADAPGPIVEMEPSGVTIHGGYVAVTVVDVSVSRAILDDESTMFDPTVIGILAPEAEAARVVVFVDPSAADTMVRSTFRCASSPGSTRVFIGGVPMTSIAAFSTVLYAYARECENTETFNFLGFGAGPTGCVALDSVSARRLRDRARAVISVSISRRLHAIRAYLWRPGGRLVANMMRTWTSS